MDNILKLNIQSEIGQLEGVILHSPGAEVENMEGAAVFAVCHRYGVPCAEIRAVSNYVDDPRELWDIPAALTALAEAIKNIL